VLTLRRNVLLLGCGAAVAGRLGGRGHDVLLF
jgi:hypothetical protein